MLHVLVPLDGSKLAEQALDHAVAFARLFEVELHLLRVTERNTADSDSAFDRLDWELLCSQCESYLHELGKSLAAQNIESHLHVLEGNPPTEINTFCRTHHIDLMVMTAWGKGGVTDFDHGSTAQKIISKSDQSILIIRPETGVHEAAENYKRLLVVMDGSRRSDSAVMIAAALATEFNSTLELLQLLTKPSVAPRVAASTEGKEIIQRLMQLSRQDAQKHLAEIRTRLPTNLPIEAHICVAQDMPQLFEEIVQRDNVNLLLLGSHTILANSFEPHSMVTNYVAAKVSCPVLMLQDDQSQSFQLKPRRRELMHGDNLQPSLPNRATAG